MGIHLKPDKKANLIVKQKRLPNLFIPGAGKSGTSSLHAYLNYHKDVSMSTIKEPHFWTRLDFESLNIDAFNDYFSLFKHNAKIKGESSTGYLFFEDFIENIKKTYLTTPKFIIVLKNPIDRIYSHYKWLKGVGSETLSLKDAVLKDLQQIPDQSHQLPEQYYKSYFQFGLYGKNIKKFYKAFGADNIHIITSENLLLKNLETVNSCYNFLNLPKVNTLPKIQINKSVILRYPWLYKNFKAFALQKSRIKTLAKPFFSESLRLKLNENIYPAIHKLTSTSKVYPELKLPERLWLKQLYTDDVILLKKITQQTFSVWKDFNDL